MFVESFVWGVDGDDWVLEERIVLLGCGIGYFILFYVRYELGCFFMIVYEFEFL